MDEIIELLKKNLTVAITVLTGVSYFICYQYEVGACNFYGVPTDLINLSLTNILKVASSAIAILASGISALKAINEIFEGSVRKRLIGETIVLFGSVLVFNYFVFEASITTTIITFCLFMLAFWYRLNRINKFQRKVDEAKKAIKASNPNISPELFATKLAAKFENEKNEEFKSDSKLLYFGTAMMVMTFGIQNMGKNSAKRTKDHQVLVEKPSFVLLKQYGDTYVFREIKNSVLTKNMAVIKQSPSMPILLRDTTLLLKEYK